MVSLKAKAMKLSLNFPKIQIVWMVIYCAHLLVLKLIFDRFYDR